MGLTAFNAKRGLDAKIDGAVRFRVYTLDWGAELIAFTIAFTAATEACPSVATVGSTPIADTWDADGTAGSYRVTNADGSVVYAEHAGGNAVAATGSPHALLSSVTAVTGVAVSLDSFVWTEVCPFAGA